MQVAGRSVTSGTQTLTLRKGTVIDLVLSGAGPSVGQDGGLPFQAGVGFSGGGFKHAVLTSRAGSSATYSVTIPRDLSGTLMFETRVALIGPDGRAVPPGRSSGLTVRGGPARITGYRP